MHITYKRFRKTIFFKRVFNLKKGVPHTKNWRKCIIEMIFQSRYENYINRHTENKNGCNISKNMYILRERRIKKREEERKVGMDTFSRASGIGPEQNINGWFGSNFSTKWVDFGTLHWESIGFDPILGSALRTNSESSSLEFHFFFHRDALDLWTINPKIMSY